MATQEMEFDPRGKSQIQRLSIVTPYTKLFAETRNHKAAILTGLGRLMTCIGHQGNPDQLEIWAQNLERFSASQLAEALYQTEVSVKSWPSLAHIVGFLTDPMWQQDLALLLQGIIRHGKEWRTLPGKRTRRDRTEAEVEAMLALSPPLESMHPTQRRITLDEARVEWTEDPETPAPEIPPYALAAVLTLGNGDRTTGLELIREHPACRFWERLEIDRPPTAQLLAAQRQVEERFKAAWLAAFFASEAE